MIRSILVLIILIGDLMLSACQTHMYEEYSKLHPGMEKEDVLQVMGSPQRTQRFHGKDRWTYIFYDNQLRHEKEVQFFEGNAVYIGDPWQPEISAAQIDSKNEASNKALEEESLRKLQENPKAYSNYESQIRGTDKIRTIPQFKPVQ
ncbi:MAG: outer membrane protein assembly factor BamE [Pseudobdellovibrionaceae bacterium]